MPDTIGPLTDRELARYSRQLNLREVGVEGQAKLKHASVLLVGLGGLGSPLALYLTAAGVGRIGIVEFDTVDISNLHRQVLFGASQVGEYKLAAGSPRLRDLNPDVTIEEHACALTRETAREIVSGYDLVADGADNFATRYLVNDACVLEGKPLVSASILAFEGQLSVFNHAAGPCYRCLYPEPPPPGLIPSCAEGGVLGVLPGVMGTLQATEVIKLILGLGEVASGRLVQYDALSLTVSSFRVPRNPQCVICGDDPVIDELVDYDEFCGVGGTGDTTIPQLSPAETAQLLDSAGKAILIDVREDHERLADTLPHSRHVPLQELLANGVPFSPSTRLVIFCASGARSELAAQSLKQRGYTDVRNLAGGLSAWRRFFPA